MSPRPFELPESDFDDAIRLARAGRFSEAVESIGRRMEDPEVRESRGNRAANALARIGRLALAAGDESVAEAALSAATRIRPRFADLQFQRACLLLRRHDREGARRALQRAIELNPRYTAARVELAMLDAREGLVGEALEALRTLARETPIDDPGVFERGLTSLARADWNDADALLHRALRLPDAELDEELGRVRHLLEAGETARAAQALRELLARHEAYPDLHHFLGLAELKLGHFDDALDSFARALELNPDFHAVRLQFARTLDVLGQGAQAAEQVALVLEHEPEHAEALELTKEWAQRSPRRSGAAARRAAA